MALSRYLVFIISLFVLAACGGSGGGGLPLPGNFDPTANAGSAQTVNEGDVVQLQGIGVDLDGTIAAYLWTQASGPAVTLSDTSITNPTFTAPQVSAQTDLIFNLTVTDNDGATDTNGVIITVNDTNTPPTANAGADDTVSEGANYQLMGAGSDAEGAVTFAWSQSSGTQVVLSDATIASPSFTAPLVAANEVLLFVLTVTDSDGLTAMDTVAITVNDAAGNTPPTVNAGPDQNVTEGDIVQLAGSGSDAEGAVTFQWTQDSGPAVTLSDTTIVNPTFTAPQVNSQTSLQFTLTVTDSANATTTDSVNIIVNAMPPTGGSTASYLFYSHDLNAVDPTNPAAPAFIEAAANIVTKSSSGTSATLLRSGTYNSVNNTVTDVHTRALIYANSTDGRLYKVDGVISGSIIPVQVSNESQADQICVFASGDSPTYVDLANTDNSMYVYAIPSPGTTCSAKNYIWKAVRFGMGAATAPIAAKEPIQDIDDLATGALSGWLVHDAGFLRKCDPNFANCTNIVAVTSSVNSIIHLGINRSLLEIDSQLYVYYADTNTLSASLFTIPSGTFTTIPASDGTTVYFGHGQNLYSFPANGSAAATVLFAESANILQRVLLTGNKLIYQTGTLAVVTALKAIPKAGGTPITLATATGIDHIVLLSSNTTYLYYNIQNYNTGGSFAIIPVSAGVVDENGGNKTETANSAWVGGALMTSFDFNAGSDFASYDETMIRADGFDLAGTSGGYATATLRSVNAATAAVGVTIGVMPDGEEISGINCFSIGPDIICGSYNKISPAPVPPAITSQYDIYYLHATTANSLVRVTTTPAQSEILVF